VGDFRPRCLRKAGREGNGHALDGFTLPLSNLQGGLILTAVALRVGMKILIHVYLTDKRTTAEVVYVDPDQPRHYGIKLERPENIWGVSLPPDNWHEE
jgi:hypothetical protein